MVSRGDFNLHLVRRLSVFLRDNPIAASPECLLMLKSGSSISFIKIKLLF